MITNICLDFGGLCYSMLFMIRTMCTDNPSPIRLETAASELVFTNDFAKYFAKYLVWDIIHINHFSTEWYIFFFLSRVVSFILKCSAEQRWILLNILYLLVKSEGRQPDMRNDWFKFCIKPNISRNYWWMPAQITHHRGRESASIGVCSTDLRLDTSTKGLKQVYTSTEEILLKTYFLKNVHSKIIYNFWHKSFCLKQPQHFGLLLNKIALF